MHNFIFHNPTKIIFGKDTIPQIGPETKNYGNRALLIYGRKSIKESGLYDIVQKSLDDAEVSITEHPGVQSNPLLSHVREGIRIAKQENIDVVVAVGGGSVIDSAKAICAGALVDHDVWQFFRGKKGVKKALPLTSVLTLAASGSEMNGGMVVTKEETKQKFGTGSSHLNPKVSILDPSTTFTVPPDYTAYGAVDAIAHILEVYFTTEDAATTVQDRFMEGLILNIMDSCERVLKNPTDYDGRADLMWCATLALNGLTSAGLGWVNFPMHMIEHSLSAFYNIAHGAGLSVVIPGWMTYTANEKPEKFDQFAQRIFNLKNDSPSQNAADGIEQLKEWFNSINSPTSLDALGIPDTDIPDIAENAVGLAKIWRMRNYPQDKIAEILNCCI